jgi:hypothetical protein
VVTAMTCMKWYSIAFIAIVSLLLFSNPGYAADQKAKSAASGVSNKLRSAPSSPPGARGGALRINTNNAATQTHNGKSQLRSQKVSSMSMIAARDSRSRCSGKFRVGEARRKLRNFNWTRNIPTNTLSLELTVDCLYNFVH